MNEDTTVSSSGHCVFSLPIMSVNVGLLQKWEEIRIGLISCGCPEEATLDGIKEYSVSRGFSTLPRRKAKRRTM